MEQFDYAHGRVLDRLVDIFPKAFINLDPVAVTLGQFIFENGGEPFHFKNDKSGYGLHRQIDGKSAVRTQEKRMLIADREMRDKWIEILIHVNWSEGRDGFFRVYVNGKAAPV